MNAYSQYSHLYYHLSNVMHPLYPNHSRSSTTPPTPYQTIQAAAHHTLLATSPISLRALLTGPPQALGFSLLQSVCQIMPFVLQK